MSTLRKLFEPRLPSEAIGLSGEGACVVSLDHRRGDVFNVRKAAYAALREGLVRPSFDEQNISDTAELADALAELVTNVGLLKRRRWSVALPEAAARTSILTLEGTPSSRGEREEMLRWKTERTVGASLDELRVGRERLRPDSQGRDRYLLTAVRLSVLSEYERVFEALGWQTGLMLPRHAGEAWWLMRRGGAAAAGDSLLVSSHREGFTAGVFRAGQPMLLRSVICDPEDRADELYRFVLFYRDRNAPPPGEPEAANAVASAAPAAAPDETIETMLVAGTGLDAAEAGAIVRETLSVPPRALGPGDLRLSFPSGQLDFNLIAAPAGLAALAWA
ncbi:MAG TPA: hypothetical protein VF240_22625 [Pyrinomonadaceae bacterium]